ncbi:uncharacterized protein LOC132263776 [Phlebotomus argentipes]|uniref:uncharacterized protein LOC132263776 n=1 Tax=Phlebotomus argentipes TaxID=94469 RepID=UPI002892ECB3|nr:uncharacterized protein LOC132263776 [Phlebotomus argentipes]
MDEFMQLKWSKSYPRILRTRRDVYSNGFSDDECDVFICHMNETEPEFYDRFQGYVDFNRKVDHDVQMETMQTMQMSPGSHIKNKHQDDKVLQLFKKFPAKSKMNNMIHKSCLRVLKDLEQGQGCEESEMNNVDWKNYFSCKTVRQQEKVEFCEFVKNHFLTYLRHRLLKIDVEMENVLIEKWRQDVKIVKQRLQQDYQLQTALSIDKQLTESAVNLTHPEHFYRSGEAPKMTSFMPDEIIVLQQNTDQLRKYLRDEMTSKETQCVIINEEFAQKTKSDFILPLETLEFLVNGSNRTWNIPFRIKECAGMKLGIIESPLPPICMDTKQRNSEILNYCFKLKVLQHTTELSEEKLGSPDNNININLAEFSERDSDDEGQLIIDEFLEEKSEDKRSEEKEATEIKSEVNALSIDQKRMHCSLLNACILSSGKDSCRLLVKVNQDASVLRNGMTKMMNFSTKIEYQSEFGAEEMTVDELIHEWSLQIFSPESITLRIRIDSRTLQVLSMKEISLKRTEKDLERLYGLTSHDLLQRLWSVLSVMKNFPVQDYLMNHELIHDKKLMIYMCRRSETPDSNHLHLSKLFDNVQFKRKPLLEHYEWIPIDDHEVCYIHEHANVMPCAFPHWGRAGKMDIWNEKQLLMGKYEERMKAKTESKLNHEKRVKSEKNRARKMRKQQAKKEKKLLQKAQEDSKKFGKILSQSGDNTVPDWFFDEEGRVKHHKNC